MVSQWRYRTKGEFEEGIWGGGVGRALWDQRCELQADGAASLNLVYHIRHGNVTSIFFSLEDQSHQNPFKQQWNNSLFVQCGLWGAILVSMEVCRVVFVAGLGTRWRWRLFFDSLWKFNLIFPFFHMVYFNIEMNAECYKLRYMYIFVHNWQSL